jgi:hypothetical protein
MSLDRIYELWDELAPWISAQLSATLSGPHPAIATALPIVSRILVPERRCR